MIFQTVQDSTGCTKSREPILILIIFRIFNYRLKLKVERVKMALTFDEMVEIVLLNDRVKTVGEPGYFVAS
jgi:hypothetical protein